MAKAWEVYGYDWDDDDYDEDDDFSSTFGTY